ncbi:unnamed protein product [Lasius platythorax]|uniref:Uncharacterized protein n=1 Tax=Lasius platythorax TaxID=488582 RepID=A0AAV2NQ07_9HYME
MNEKSAPEWSQSDNARSCRFIVEDGEFLFLRIDAVSQDDAIPPSMKKRKKERPSSRAPFSQVYEIRGIQFGGEFALNGHGTRLTPDPSRVSTRSAGMCLGARREINLNPRTRKAPALTRTSATPATHPFLSLLRLVYWKSCVKIAEG